MNNKPAIEDRIWAIIAHLSALAMGMGLLLPVVGWSETRRKSNYTSFQCLQALGYQSLGYTVWILTTLVVIFVVGVVAVAGIATVENLEEEMFAIFATHMALMFGLIGIYFALPIIASIACAFGKDFHYPLMGNRLARYLGYKSMQLDSEQPWLLEEHEDRWVAAMGHFSVIIVFWGMLAPVTAWIVQGRRSLFLKFQSVQAFAFQAGTLILYFASGALYVGGLLFFLLSIGMSGSPNLESPAGITGIIVFAGSMLCTFAIVLIVPLLHIMGQWAGYRVLKGDEYRYPLVGRLVEKWVMK